MPEPLLHIARAGSAIGTFTLEEARELVDAGFLHGTDEGWIRGMDEWQPLQSILGQPGIPLADWRDKVIAGATAVSGVVGRSVGDFVKNVRARAAKGQSALTQAKTLALDHFLPQFQKRAAEYLRDKPVAFVKEAARNTEAARKVFGALYDCLPRPLCRFVSEPDFIAFCMEHRQRLLGQPAPPVPDPPPPPVPPEP